MILFASLLAITSCGEDEPSITLCEPRPNNSVHCLHLKSKVEEDIHYDDWVRMGPICTKSDIDFAKMKEHHKLLHQKIEELEAELARGN